MPSLIKFLLAAAAMIAIALSTTLSAEAGDPQIDAAITQGVIGERVDGYLGVVAGDVEPALMRKMNDINNQRRALYAKLAAETNTTTAQVARLTGEKQIANAASGSYVMAENGQWTRK